MNLDILNFIFNILGGLGIFLFGMTMLSDGMQRVAGEKLKSILSTLTNNRYIAILIGFIATVFVQSSSITTVITIGFVNAGLMTLIQSLGVILGANVGTTITGWVLVLNIGKYGLWLIGIFSILYVFSKSEKLKNIGGTFLGLGLVFYGLELMKDGFAPLKEYPQFEQWFHRFDATTGIGAVISAALVGAILTMIVQSSSATLGVTISLATSGLINAPTAVALVLGENVGTTITAMLASLGANKNAKRAALAHTTINVCGVIWVIAIFPLYLLFLNKISNPETNVTRYIATAHTMFNVINAFIFSFLLTPLSKFLMYVIKDDANEHEKIVQVDSRMLEIPSLLISSINSEVLKLNKSIISMFDILKNNILNEYLENNKDVQFIFKEEDRIDIVQSQLTSYSLKLYEKDLTQEQVEELQKNLIITDELESLSDYMMTQQKHILKLKNNNLYLSDEKKEEISDLQNEVSNYLKYVLDHFDSEIITNEFLIESVETNNNIKNKFKAYRAAHLKRMESKSNVNPLLSTLYIDMLNVYRRFSNHILNIAEVITSNKN